MEDSKLTVIEHLDELRKRIIIIAISILIGTGTGYLFIEELVSIIVRPAVNLDFIYISPPELFLEYIKISFLFGVVVSMPVIIVQIWIFMKPGLKKKEKFFVLFSMIMGLIFFILGIVFAYFVITPLSLKFFADMSFDQISPLFSFSNYIKFISSLLASFGLVFELPMIVILLTQLNLVTPSAFKRYRKIVILAVFVLAALLTPPDVISQILMGVPMVLLYELSILFSIVIYNKKQKKMLEERGTQNMKHKAIIVIGVIILASFTIYIKAGGENEEKKDVGVILESKKVEESFELGKNEYEDSDNTASEQSEIKENSNYKGEDSNNTSKEIKKEVVVKEVDNKIKSYAADELIEENLNSIDNENQREQCKVNEEQKNEQENLGEKEYDNKSMQNSSIYNDGLYEGEGYGKKPGIKVTIIIKEGRIIEIKVISHKETQVFYEMAADEIIKSIILEQSSEVDVTSGATMTSNGIMDAVGDALKKAVK